VPVAEDEGVLDVLLVLHRLPLRLGRLVGSAEQLRHEPAASEAERRAEDLRVVVLAVLLNGLERAHEGVVGVGRSDHGEDIADRGLRGCRPAARGADATNCGEGRGERGADEDDLVRPQVPHDVVRAQLRHVGGADGDVGLDVGLDRGADDSPGLQILLKPLELAVVGDALALDAPRDSQEGRGLGLVHEDAVGHVDDRPRGDLIGRGAVARDQRRGGAGERLEIRHERSPLL
jgi:hypothetical protein